MRIKTLILELSGHRILGQAGRTFRGAGRTWPPVGKAPEWSNLYKRPLFQTIAA